MKNKDTISEVISLIKNGQDIPIELLLTTLDLALSLFIKEPTLLYLESPITLCGDIHGQLYDLYEVFRIAGEPPATSYLFLGDYVDRGYYSIETFTLLLCLKLKYPTRVHLLRGNHESRNVTYVYGFYDECTRKYDVTLYRKFCEVFDFLPISAIIDGKNFCVHGGLDPSLKNLNEIENFEKGMEVPHEGYVCSLLWSDPREEEGFELSSRGAGYFFGPNVTDKFLRNNNLEKIYRAHQLVDQGYNITHEGKILTIFSAPNYCYRCKNLAAIVNYKNGKEEIISYESAPRHDGIENEIKNREFEFGILGKL